MLLTFFIALPLLTACFIGLLQTRHAALIEKVAVVAALADLGLILVLIPGVIEHGAESSTLFSLDPLGAFLAFIIATLGVFASIYSVGYLRSEIAKGIIELARVRQFFFLLELFLFAMVLAVATTNPIIMWIAIEATTLSTVFLISFYNKPSATEAAWKYLMLNSLGLLIGLLGSLLFLGLLNIGSETMSWLDLATAATATSSAAAFKVAFVLIFIGYGTKVGLAPLHAWLPDAHSKAPSPISALLSGVLLNVALLAVLRWKHITDVALSGSTFTSNLLIFFGVLTVCVAAFIIFIQKNYKRLLAYSSMEHMGLITLGFGFGGVGSLAALLHMLYHALSKSLIFFSAGNILLKYSSTKMRHVSGVLKTLPLTGIIFLAAACALLGLPPFGTLVTEFLLLSSGMTVAPGAVVIVLVALAVIFFGFLKHLVGMLFGALPQGVEVGEAHALTQTPLLVLLALLVVLSWYLPATLSLLLQLAAGNPSFNL